jgi:hypothetical protein
MDGVRNIEELQTRLDGVFDLGNVDDCRKMIDVLLRSIKEKDMAAQQSKDRLKLLSLMVINDNPDAKAKAREAMALSGSSKKEVSNFMSDMVGMMNLADSMTTKQIITYVIENIWMEYDMSGRESAILGEMIRRMKLFAGLPVTPDDVEV